MCELERNEILFELVGIDVGISSSYGYPNDHRVFMLCTRIDEK